MAVKVGAGGRLVIPGEYRAALGIAPGDVVVLVLERDGLRLLTPGQAVRRAQDLVSKYVGPERSLSDELIAERREEADAS
jgi:AbrB family looped-hinge helix DNA binding protein